MINRRFLVSRGLVLLATFFVAITLNFFLPRLMGGDPTTVIASEIRLPPEVRQNMIRLFGLDKDIFTQYREYLVNTLLLNFGYSFDKYPATVSQLILERLPWTLLLVGTSTVVSIVLGFVIGVESAWRRGSWIDTLVQWLSISAWSAPVFWIAMILILVFAYYLRLFPVTSAESAVVSYRSPLEMVLDRLWHLALPMTTLVISNLAIYVMTMRSAMIEILDEDFMLFGAAKGLPERTLKYGYAARNAILPMTTLVALSMATIFGGAVFVEIVFSYPGLGTLIYDALNTRDYPVIQGTFYILTVSVIIANFIADIAYAFLDPRVRY